MSKPLFVEFTGVTGVGKTTLLEATTDHLMQQGVRIIDAYDAILTLFRLPRISHALIKSAVVDLLVLIPATQSLCTPTGLKLLRNSAKLIVRDAGSLSERINLFRNFIKRVGVSEILRRNRKYLTEYDLIVFDEGIIHLVHNLFVYTKVAPNPDELLAYVQLISQNDKVIWVKGSKEQSIASIMQRGHPRVKNPMSEAEDFIDHGYYVYNLVFSQPTIRERWEVVEYNHGEETNQMPVLQNKVHHIASLLEQDFAR